MSFTCLACHIAFATPDHQRDHYRTDWHKYNLKRKVAELPPISVELFNQKILSKSASKKHPFYESFLDQKLQQKQDAERHEFQKECTACR